MQGPYTSKPGDRKVEPKAHAVNVKAVAEIGIIEVRANSLPLYSGRGFQAPAPRSVDTHPHGSQGKR